MHPEEPHVQHAAECLAQRLGEAPQVAIVLGSGLGPITKAVDVSARAPTTELGLPGSTVPGHAGEVLVGDWGKTRVAVLSGRVHLYEGHPPDVLVRYVRAFHAWGVKSLLLTCSVGGIASGLTPGRMVLVSDHINLQHNNPLVGPAYGTRFPDLSKAYDPRLRGELQRAADVAGVSLPSGVLAAMSGPAYETPAEVRMVRTLGADIVGMSTVPEVLAAAALQFPTVVIAVVSNRAAGLSDQALTHDEVTETANMVAHQLRAILDEALNAF